MYQVRISTRQRRRQQVRRPRMYQVWISTRQRRCQQVQVSRRQGVQAAILRCSLQVLRRQQEDQVSRRQRVQVVRPRGVV